MAWDLAIDYATGDLQLSPTGDFDARTGAGVTRQRIHARLKIIRGIWHLDPTNGQIGSHLNQVQRMPMQQAAAQAELFAREALEPLEDVSIEDIVVEVTDTNVLAVTVSYSMIEEGSEAGTEGDIETMTMTIPAG